MNKLVRSMRQKQAFTLVELMIVVTIVAILALIAIPLYSQNTIAAIMSEGVSGCGTIRTALQVYYAQNGTWATVTPNGAMTGTTNLQIGSNDLNGKYFQQGDYALSNLSGSTYTITATAPSTAGKAAGLTYAINQLGSESGSYTTGQ